MVLYVTVDRVTVHPEGKAEEVRAYGQDDNCADKLACHEVSDHLTKDTHLPMRSAVEMTRGMIMF